MVVSSTVALPFLRSPRVLLDRKLGESLGQSDAICCGSLY
jgi:hypothetical protein